MSDTVPDAVAAATLVQQALQLPVVTVDRLTTGLANWVFAVTLATGQEVVIRLQRSGQGDRFAAAIGWQRLLAPLGLPLPRLLAHDVRPASQQFPYMIQERLPGTDLGNVYTALSQAEKEALAGEIVAVQAAVGTLPAASGYGFARGYGDPWLHRSWAAVVQAELDRSEQRIQAAGRVAPALCAALRTHLDTFQDYFATIPPIPFLDDTTTKNVLIDAGKLVGIVDIDVVCFGDPLFTPALTRMSLLNRGNDLDYIDAWLAHLYLNADQRRAFDFYTALFCLNFISEFGQQFNGLPVATNEAEQLAHLQRLFADLLQPLTTA